MPDVTWAEFESSAPDLVSSGSDLLFHPGFGFGYLATVSEAGGPRIHPINPLISDGHLLAFIMPTPKLEDLRANGRYALHSSQTETVDDEFMLAGRAVLREADRGLRQASLSGHPLTVGEDHVLVEFLIRRALLVHYPGAGASPESRVWSAPG
ncbi:MAG TPA: hypothetical protein VLB85_01045 [Acidimicrobiia bacterium]|nr:hypothetical protein [Acidimicrobiia bacterium]